ncbi:uncharacterized protein [Mytilus edulis]|uniref:uncharacterized protein n=1 Tax=Mytilus edulis TaxID=6550 RepID=UPI0039F08ED8
MHTFIQCDGCKQYPLRGMRWNCLPCAHYNLCTQCYMSDQHDVSHIFTRITSERCKGVEMEPRENLDLKAAYGILPNSNVQLRNNFREKGRVEHSTEKTIESFRSFALVQWPDYSKGRYCAGWNGQCELKFTKAAKGPMYYEEHLPFVTIKNARKGTRIVNCQRMEGGHGYVGTIVYIEHQEDGCIVEKRKSEEVMTTADVTVQWDDGNFSKYSLPCNKIRLFDNGPSEVEHDGQFCLFCRTPSAHIRGIRWKCIHEECVKFNLNLCNICYMAGKHKLRHKFQRFIFPDIGETMVFSRHSKPSYNQSYGIFVGATVIEVSKKGEKGQGITIAICNSMIDSDQSEVAVKWNYKTKISFHPILDLKCTKTRMPFLYYHNQLPVLGKADSRGYFEVNFTFENGSTTKIQVDILRSVKPVEKDTFKPSLFLIFADHPELYREKSQDDKMVLMEEVITFAKETSLPCYVVHPMVLFHSGSTNTACIYNKTTKETIKELVKRGFCKFERGNIEDNEDEIHCFIRLAKYVIGENVLPVIISLGNGGISTSVMNSAAQSKIPIIRFKKHKIDIRVFTPEKLQKGKLKITEHKTDIQNPWNVKESESWNIELAKINLHEDPDEIVLLSEIQPNFQHNLDVLVCCLIIGVSMEENSSERSTKKSNSTAIFLDALSMYLLKEGKWNIPKEQMKKSFNLKSINYIHEKDMTSEMKTGLWSHLQYSTRMAYKALDFEGDTLQLERSKSEMFGFIFCTLLQKQYYAGAKQLIETGYIKIRHILLGCSILHDVANNGITNPVLKERLQRLRLAFTQRAIRIISCIHYADKKRQKHEKDTSKKKEHTIQKYNKHYSKNNGKRELGDYINHAGQLLLSRGYLETAIKTENKMFFDDSIVKDILNTMWYGTDQFDFRTILCFIGLALFHIVLLPLLMINMEARPLRWFYKKYKLPFMKVFMHTLGFLTLIFAYGYMLLFDYSEVGVTYTDYFVISLMVSFFVDENKQHLVAIMRRRWKIYITSWWNILDWMSILVYTCGMLLKLGEGSNFQNASKVCLIAAFILLCIRILNLFCISSILGPKLVMIQQMFRDTFSFMIIMAVIMTCYNVSFYALLYPNSEFSWQEMEKIAMTGYWMLFGELNLDGDTMTEPDCTFNNTIYQSGASQRCPTQLGVYLSPYLKATYGLIAVILLLNLLIAIYSNTFQSVHQESEYYWSQLQNDFLEEYSVKTVFPIHLQLLVLPIAIMHAILWLFCPCGEILCVTCCGEEEREEAESVNHMPMFVRVFLYNTNFDLRLKTTNEAERNGGLYAKGEIDFIDFDRITGPQQKEGSERRNDKIMKRLQNIENSLNDLHEMLSKNELIGRQGT